MDYQDAIDWLYSQLPIFQKQGKQAYHPGLDNIKMLLAELDNPETQFKTIHIAGTNGKGSVSHMLSAVLQTAGYKTGLYTSPHLKNFEERIKINGLEIDKKSVIEFTSQMQKSNVKPSFFEMTVALAFQSFARAKVDIAIIETGMGGRLDSTNVINPELSIITNISLDHQQFLGDTLTQIAKEKAGIIKLNTSVVIGENNDETYEVFENAARSLSAPLYYSDDVVCDFSCDLKGAYQVQNIKTAYTALKLLRQLNYIIPEDNIKHAFNNIQSLTGLKGRYQKLNEQPQIIADTGHNIAAFKYLIPQILNEPHKYLHMVFGMANDKDINSILELLPTNATYYFCKPDVARGLNVQELQKLAEDHSLTGTSYNTVGDALKAAKQKANKEDLIFIGGSTFVVAEVV